ncbi:MAG: hypothetical protein AAGJ81_08150 [Verrucomicrobiota bacterium]
MAATTISDLWEPQVWVQGLNERVRTDPSLIGSPVFVQNDLLDQAASGGGLTINVPGYRDLSEDAETNQGGTISLGAHGDIMNIAAIMNREKGWGVEALATAISNTPGRTQDPVANILSQLATNRRFRNQTTLMNILRGIISEGSGGALSANAVGAFDEDAVGGTPELIDSDLITDAVAVMGDLGDSLQGGILYAHSNIIAALRKLDENDFHYVSRGSLTITMFRELQIITDRRLARPGQTSGSVYDTYILAPGSFGYGAKPQGLDVIDVASLQRSMDKEKNVTGIYDRTRQIIHPDGMKWTGELSDDAGPTNAELADAANWALGVSTADRVPLVGIFTNG